MLQKDNLGQDMFLIGPPGPEKFRIAHIYAQLVQQEIEYVALSRDTTESDLKQRREIRNGTAFFEDQVESPFKNVYILVYMALEINICLGCCKSCHSWKDFDSGWD